MLAQRPITVCAIGLLVAMTVSQLAHGRFGVVDEDVPEFLKVLLYFLLLMAIVNTPRRLIALLAWLVVFVCVLSTFALLQYHEMIDIERFARSSREPPILKRVSVSVFRVCAPPGSTTTRTTSVSFSSRVSPAASAWRRWRGRFR